MHVQFVAPSCRGEEFLWKPYKTFEFSYFFAQFFLRLECRTLVYVAYESEQNRCTACLSALVIYFIYLSHLPLPFFSDTITQDSRMAFLSFIPVVAFDTPPCI